jgi:hypothetical protein
MLRTLLIALDFLFGSLCGLFFSVWADLVWNDHRNPPLEAKAWQKEYCGRVLEHKWLMGGWLLVWGLGGVGICATIEPNPENRDEL